MLKLQVQNQTDWGQFLLNAKSSVLINWKCENSSTLSKNDFEFLKTLGSGAYGEVKLARRKWDKSIHAIKIMDKINIMADNYTEHVLNEKRALLATDFPFIIHMESFFDDDKKIYFVTPYIPGGDLWYELRRRGRFSEGAAKFYGWQVLLALEYLHYIDLIYRDLKPENILIDADGYIKLADLGFCKPVTGRTYTLCGTAEYTAPEVILNTGYGLAADWWSFGVLLFELCAGRTPFVDKSLWRQLENISKGNYTMDEGFSNNLKDLVPNLLKTKPTERYGCHKADVEKIKEHKWFADIKWFDVLNKKVPPPFLP